MKSLDQRFSDLLLDVYEAAANPAHWEIFLENAAREMSATKAALHVHYFAPGNTIQTAHGSCAFAIGYDASSLADYAAHYAPQDIYVQKIRERFPGGMQAGTSDDLLIYSEYRRTELYADFSRPNGVYYNCWSAVEQSSSLAAGVGFIRPEDARPFAAKDVNLLKLLNPHLKKAFQLQRVIAAVADRNTALLSSVAHLDLGVIAIGSSGTVTNLSAPAKRILDEQDGIRVRSGRLEAAIRSEDDRLQQMLATAANMSMADTGGNTMLVSRPQGKQPLKLSVFPFVSTCLLAEDRPQLIVLLSDPSAKPASRAAVMRSLYGLSPTESRLSDLLLEGCEVSEAADHLGTTRETTRFHLKRVMAKTGARRQAELVRLMLSLPGLPQES